MAKIQKSNVVALKLGDLVKVKDSQGRSDELRSYGDRSGRAEQPFTAFWCNASRPLPILNCWAISLKSSRLRGRHARSSGAKPLRRAARAAEARWRN